MSSLLPYLNYSSKSDLADVLTTNGLPTDNFLALNEDFGMAFFELYIPHILPTLSTEQRTTLADELVCTCRAITPFSYSWNTTKAEKREQKQLEMTYWGKMGSLLQQHALVPSEYHYSRYLWNITNKTLIPEYFEWLHTIGAVLRSDSMACNDTWYLVLDHCANKEDIAGAQWLIDHNIWPTCQGVKPTYAYGSVREDDTIFSWVRYSKGVALLKQLPNERLKACMNHTNGLGRTPLHHATASLMPEMVEFLLELGADKSPQDNKGKYPLDMIRKTTSRVEHIAAIQNLLGGVTSKSSEELLLDAVKKFDTALLSQALKDPQILARKADVVFDVLGNTIGNTTPSVYKKMRARKIQMVEMLLDGIAVNHQNSDGNTFLHAAIQSGLVSTVEYLLMCDPHLAGVRNTNGKTPADINIEEFDKLIHYQHGVHQSYSDVSLKMQQDTSKKILKLFNKYHVEIYETNFPALIEDEQWRAILSKQRLERVLGHTTGQNSKRKI